MLTARVLDRSGSMANPNNTNQRMNAAKNAVNNLAKGSAEGVTYDSTVYEGTITVTDNGKGELEAVIEGAGEITFTNTYEKQVPPPAPNPAPPTGDPTSVFVWMIVMLAAVLALAGLKTFRKRR